MLWGLKKGNEDGFNRQFLLATPLFKNIPPRSQAFDRFLRKIQVVRFKRSQIVYEAGDIQSHIYIVREGEVHINRAGIHGRLIAVNGKGSIFGEVSYLSGEPHSTMATAVLDTVLYVIPGRAMHSLLRDEPSVGHSLAQLLSRRLHSNLKEFSESPARIYSLIYPENPARGALIARHLARSLVGENPGAIVLISFNINRNKTPGRPVDLNKLLEQWNKLTIQDLRKMLGNSGTEDYDQIDGHNLLNHWKDSPEKLDQIPGLLGLLKKYYSVILIDFKSDHENPLQSRIVSQSDRLILVRSLNHPPEDPMAHPWNRFLHLCRHTVQELNQRILTVTDESTHQGYSLTDIHNLDPFIAESSIIYRTHIRVKSLTPDSLSEDYDPVLLRSIQRLARRLSGTSRGISLGGGGARTLAHLGVLQIMEDEGIEFDAVSGSSMGAIIGAAYGLGFRSDEIIEIIRKLIPKSSSILDRNLPLISFFRGKKIGNMLHDFFGNSRFEDMEIPFYCNGSDLISGKSIIFQKGPLVPALRATVSIPGFFPPVEIDDMRIVDGSVLNTLPGDILFKRGIDRVIGVNVTPNLDPESANTHIRGEENIIRGIHDYISLPPILKIVTRSMAIQGMALMNTEIRNIDFVLHPQIDDFELFDFHRLDEIVDRGRQAAVTNMAELRESLSRKEMSYSW